LAEHALLPYDLDAAAGCFDGVRCASDVYVSSLGWLITFLGEGLDVAQQGVQLGTTAANVAAYAGLSS
jgi:hypothetical protein